MLIATCYQVARGSTNHHQGEYMDYQSELEQIQQEELAAICDEIRSYGENAVYWIERQYGMALEEIKLRTLLIAVRNLREK